MLVQLIINGLVASSIIALVACGFGLFFGVHRFFNFAHGMVITFGAYGAFAAVKWCNFSLYLAFPFGVLIACLTGIWMDLFIFRPLRHREAGPLVLLIASLGIYIVLQNLVALGFGNDPQIIFRGNMKTLSVFSANITILQIVIMTVAVLLLTGSYALLNYTKLGLAMRAVANDNSLAYASGLDVEMVFLISTILASALGGAAGILMLLDTAVSPTIGMKPFMLGVIAFVIGGGSYKGAALGSFLIGLAQHVGVWKIASQWQDGIAFVILLIFLLSRQLFIFNHKGNRKRP